MKSLHQPKDPHDRSTPLPDLPAPLSSLGGPLRNQGMQGGVAALRRLHLRGYRVHSGALWYVQNDDPEDFQEAMIANWDGRAEDAEANLEMHGWPTSPWIMCSCGDGEAEFGGLCSFCARESVEWTKAGER